MRAACLTDAWNKRPHAYLCLMRVFFFRIFVFFLALPFFSFAGPHTPRFIRKEIRHYKKEPDPKKVPVITRYTYNGSYVYYFLMPCCDQQNTLYDKKGRVLCVPDGGITGKGDGRCPDFQQQKKDGVQIWPLKSED
jgi:hypothetical protein